MTTDPRAALDRMIAALEEHLVAAQQRRGESDPKVEQAYRTLADAFDTYDEAIFDAYGEATPFILYDEVEDERDDDDPEGSDDDTDDTDDDSDDDTDDDLDEDDLEPAEAPDIEDQDPEDPDEDQAHAGR